MSCSSSRFSTISIKISFGRLSSIIALPTEPILPYYFPSVGYEIRDGWKQAKCDSRAHSPMLHFASPRSALFAMSVALDSASACHSDFRTSSSYLSGSVRFSSRHITFYISSHGAFFNNYRIYLLWRTLNATANVTSLLLTLEEGERIDSLSSVRR